MYLLPKKNNLPSYVEVEQVFNQTQLNYLQNLAKNAEIRAGVGGQDRYKEKIRRSNIYWMPPKDDEENILSTLSETVADINHQHFHFDLLGFQEGLQITNYEGNEQGHYAWHMDFSEGISRKLSMVIQLSDPDSYEGGNLQLLTDSTPFTVKRQRGLAIFFPTWVLHRVTPVIKGSRQTLVAWVAGDAFR